MVKKQVVSPLSLKILFYFGEAETMEEVGTACITVVMHIRISAPIPLAYVRVLSRGNRPKEAERMGQEAMQ